MNAISGRPGGYRVFLFFVALAVFAFFSVLLIREISGPAVQLFFLLLAVCAAYCAPFSAEKYAGRREAMAARLSLRPLPPVDCLLIALAALLFMPALAMLFEQGLRLFPEYLEHAREADAAFRRGIAGQGAVLLLCFLAVLPAVCEEFFFRGLCASGLREAGFSRPWRMCFSALFFAIMHLDPWRIPPMFAIGMILIWLAERSGSILAPIMYHCANNALVLGLSFARSAAEAADPQALSQGDAPTLPSVLFVIILAAPGVCALWRFAARRQKSENAEPFLDASRSRW